MSLGSYGIKRPADVNPSDVEVIVMYSQSRNSIDNQTITKLVSTDVLKPIYSNTELGGSNIEVLGGMYNLELPKEVFNKKGIYTLYIRPVQIRVKIEDCGELSSVPDVKGLVFNTQNIPQEFSRKFTNNGLDGYRIEYLNTNGTKIENLFRVITSSFLCEPTQATTNGSSQKGIKYTYSNNGSLLYCTLTPNTAPSFRPTATPFIGRKQQTVILTNTNFNPIIKEIELVDYDIETLAIALYGDQTKSIDDGIQTLYDFNGNIHKQYDLYEVKNNLGDTLYEVRRQRTQIDSTKALSNIPYA
jgi:hypothetical protein